MRKRTKLTADFEVTHTLREISQAYEEIYLSQLRSTRSNILVKRDYINSLYHVYWEVLSSDKSATDSVVSTEEVAVYISDDSRFSGELNLKIFLYFHQYITSHQVQIVVIGHNGRDILKQHLPDIEFHYFKDYHDTALMSFLQKFPSVRVFYGKFNSLVNQSPDTCQVKSIIEKDSSLLSKINKSKPNSYLVEPTPREVRTYFENQLFRVFMEQTCNEADLAMAGSSVYELERVVHNSEDRIKLLSVLIQKESRSIANRRQQAALPAVLYEEDGGY